MSPKIDKLIRKGGDPVLKQVCAPLVRGDDVSFFETMQRVCKKAPGVGLAAPQIGVAKRVIYTLAPYEKGSPIVGQLWINPTIVSMSERTDVYEEGCLSYPGIFKRIRRPVEIRISYYDTNWRFIPNEPVWGFCARVVQHEIDHLDGICKVGDPTYLADEAEGRLEAMTVVGAINAAIGGAS